MSSRLPGIGAAGGAPSSSRPARTALAGVAAVVAIASVLSLLIVLLTTMMGGHPWTGFSWITMLGLPLAFILLTALVIDSIRARRASMSAPGRRGRP